MKIRLAAALFLLAGTWQLGAQMEVPVALAEAAYAVTVAPASGAALVITEIMSSSSHTGGADWFELTNTGAEAVDLSGYTWEDNTPRSPRATFPNGLAIAPGESVIVSNSQDVALFRANWGLSGAVQVLIVNGPGLGNGDAVNLYNREGALVATRAYLDHRAGVSRFWFADGTTSGDGYSTTGALGAFRAPFNGAAAGTDIGSPGLAMAPPAFLPPYFFSADRASGRVGLPLGFEDGGAGFLVEARDDNAGELLTLSIESGPGFLNLVPIANGLARLRTTGNLLAAQAGVHEVVLRVRDNSPAQLSATQSLTVYVFRNDSAVVLNEYNGIPPAGFLRGGDQIDDLDATGAPRTDSFFGRVAGNGGSWIELVVTGDGTPGSRVDMRGWRIEVSDAGAAPAVVTLSEDPYFAGVIAGTLLTLIDSPNAGGMDTASRMNRVNRLATDGYAWSNIHIHDPVFVNQAASTPGRWSVSNNDTQVTIRDRNGTVVFGPAGEGVPLANPGVNATEVFKLNEDPVVSGSGPVDPYFGRYRDGYSSTFGAPNSWTDTGANVVQDFAGLFAAAYAAPVILNNPPARAWVGEPYSHVVQTLGPATLRATRGDGTPLPQWLSVQGNQLVGTPGPGDTGFLLVRLEAESGGAVSPMSFWITVFGSHSPVILNEFNAVSNSNYINGGDATRDSQGRFFPAYSQDTFFGRVAGNGGDWFELVVVGDGGPGTVDLRGWRIEITTDARTPFIASDIVVLSGNAYWSAVPSGTILTFIENRGAFGGMDTAIDTVDRSATLGYRWSNIWLGDSRYVDLAASSGFSVDPVTGVTSGISINESDTQFLIKDSSGRIVFGPVGEGIAPLSGIGPTEVFELEADPRPQVRPTDLASDLPYQPGYDDGASGSTFGSPNLWEGNARIQDFTPFIPADPGIAAFAAWASGFNLPTGQRGYADSPAGDGIPNLVKFMLGAHPLQPGLPQFQPLAPGPQRARAQVRFPLRTGVAPFTTSVQWSANLADWMTMGTSRIVASHPGIPAAGFTTLTGEAESAELPGFFRVLVTHP